MGLNLLFAGTRCAVRDCPIHLFRNKCRLTHLDFRPADCLPQCLQGNCSSHWPSLRALGSLTNLRVQIPHSRRGQSHWQHAQTSPMHGPLKFSQELRAGEAHDRHQFIRVCALFMAADAPGLLSQPSHINNHQQDMRQHVQLDGTGGTFSNPTSSSSTMGALR